MRLRGPAKKYAPEFRTLHRLGQKIIHSRIPALLPFVAEHVRRQRDNRSVGQKFLYFPRSHNIKFLRSLSEDREPRLIDAWPRETKKDRARFERLKRAYVEARYSASYSITTEDLDSLAASVSRLRDIVEQVCRERLAELEAEAAA